MHEYSGFLSIADNAEACQRALNTLQVKRIGVLTPYPSSASADVIPYFNEAGFEVVATRIWIVQTLWQLRMSAKTNAAKHCWILILTMCRPSSRPELSSSF